MIASSQLAHSLPAFLRDWVLHFEKLINQAVADFAGVLPPGSRVLDAGAGEGQYKHHFVKSRYTGVDLAIGDQDWNYAGLDCVADLVRLPFRNGVFDAAINVVTLEHVAEPAAALAELNRVLRPGGRLLLIVPHEWEVHQAPHDYFRYTVHGVRYLLDKSGFIQSSIQPAGGYFRLLSRRLLNGVQFFRGPWMILGLLLLAPAGLMAPLLDFLDRDRAFTLGYICTASKR
jgi:SAM-dependent methyltransferase